MTVPYIHCRASQEITKPLVTLILQQHGDVLQAQFDQHFIKHRLHNSQRKELNAEAAAVISSLRDSLQCCSSAAEEKGVSSWLAAVPLASHGFNLSKRDFHDAAAVISSLPDSLQRCSSAAQEEGVSSWLAAVPLASYGLNLSKQDFHDAVALRYGWPLHAMPQTCVCGQTFSIDHALICKHDGFICHRHNQVCDFTAGLPQEVCTHVVTEPELQPLTDEQLGRSANTEDTARLDIRASSFWGNLQDAFLTLRSFTLLRAVTATGV